MGKKPRNEELEDELFTMIVAYRFDNLRVTLQAPDVSWNAPFKNNLRELFDDWLLHGEKS